VYGEMAQSINVLAASHIGVTMKKVGTGTKLVDEAGKTMEEIDRQIGQAGHGHHSRRGR